ncbi:MAG: hypothetical protein ABI833_00745 [Acidobacteriota bacterium]
MLARSTIGGFLLVALSAPAQERAPDPVEIVRRSVDRDWTDFASRKNYTYQERSEFRQYARNGRLSGSRSETSDVMILGGRPYQRLTARNDKRLSPREDRREQAKLDRELAKRQHESPAEHARYEKERVEERAFIREIPDAFTFRLLRTDTVSNQAAWVIEAQPKPGYRAVHSQAKDFAKVRATIWIEQATYHWVKVDADVLNTISVGFGLLRIAPGSSLHFEQTRVNDEIWLPSSMLVRFKARLALLKVLRGEYDIRYSNYLKFQSHSKMVLGQ